LYTETCIFTKPNTRPNPTPNPKPNHNHNCNLNSTLIGEEMWRLKSEVCIGKNPRTFGLLNFQIIELPVLLFVGGLIFI